MGTGLELEVLKAAPPPVGGAEPRFVERYRLSALPDCATMQLATIISSAKARS
ncbi:MAG: hypothetical protein H7A45_00475 [Verrucomicrobiales bacterium]|nr:hypothetical protein [Verrucomicrobiales bacterium]